MPLLTLRVEPLRNLSRSTAVPVCITPLRALWTNIPAIPRMTGDEAGNEIVAVSYQPRNKATLTWTNAEGVTFTIFGAFEKDVLLKMAESITPRAFLTEGDGT